VLSLTIEFNLKIMRERGGVCPRYYGIEMLTFSNSSAFFIKLNDDILFFLFVRRFILELAHITNGIVVSNDYFRDLLRENADWKDVIERRYVSIYIFYILAGKPWE